MTSNVYVARGERSGITVMKIGKANNVRRRAHQIGLAIEMSVPQLDERAALGVETHLRVFVVAQGGKRLPGTNDWFYFDDRIYPVLCAKVADLNDEATRDAEIALLVARYHRVLEEEALQAELDRLNTQVAQLKREKEQLEQEIARVKEPLLREIEALKRECDKLQKELEFYEQGRGNLNPQPSPLKASSTDQPL